MEIETEVGQDAALRPAVAGESTATLFRRQARATPDAPAIIAEERILSYGELDRLSDSLAAEIVCRNLPRAEPVAIYSDSYADVVLARLAVLKSGHFYVTIDPEYPTARIDAILADSGAHAIVTSSSTTGASRFTNQTHGLIDVSERRDEVDPSELPGDSSPDDLAYLVYTSGATGAPKGVMQTQANLARNSLRHIARADYGSGDRISGILSPSSGASNADMYGALLSGAALCPFPVRKRSLQALARWLVEYRITSLQVVPTLFRHLMAIVDPGERFPALRLIRLTSETTTRNDLELVRAHFSSRCRIYVCLASTEGSVVSDTLYDLDSLPEGHLVPLGPPREDRTVEIVDDDGAPVEKGQTGEIVVQCRHLSAGYWRDPELTRQKFETLANGDRLYRTGDLGRFLPDGQLVHLGRKDAQVKIRGHRVEPGEVELALQTGPEVMQAAVTARPNRFGDMQLVAWVVPADGTVSEEKLRQRLRQYLPESMMPSAIVMRNDLPLTPNGKLDREAISRLEIPETPTAVADADMERQVARLWAEAGGLPMNDPGDDLITSGGDSITLIHFFARVERTFGVRLPLTRLMKEVSIRSLARIIEEKPPFEPDRVLEFNVEGTRIPLFIVPGKGGNAIGMRKVAAACDPDQPVYIVQYGHEGRQLDRVELIAEDFVLLVRSIQPLGPYRIAGASFGGLVAFEMARALRAAGEAVDFIGLLDTRAGGAESIPIWRRWKEVKSRGKSPVRRILRMTRLKLGEPWRALKSYAATLMLRYGSNVPKSLAEVELQNMVASSRYRGNPYGGSVILFRAERGMFRDTGLHDLGWSKFIEGDLEIIDIPGDHFSMASDENAPILATKIQDVLERAASKDES